jgi:hypothetical protein
MPRADGCPGLSLERNNNKTRVMKSKHERQLDRGEIAVEAYRIWETRGKPAGQDVPCWLEAERQLRAHSPPLCGNGRGSGPRLGGNRSSRFRSRNDGPVYDGE